MSGTSWGPLAAQTFGALGTGYLNYQSQQNTNEQNAGIARENNAFQERMSSTAHQREVSDMTSAGLNPVLSAGAGASTPSGSTPTMQAPQINMPDLMAGYTSMRQLDQQQQKIDIDRANSASTIAHNLTDNELKKAQTILANKGKLRATAEGEMAEILSNGIKKIKESITNPQGLLHKLDDQIQTTPDDSPYNKDKYQDFTSKRIMRP